MPVPGYVRSPVVEELPCADGWVCPQDEVRQAVAVTVCLGVTAINIGNNARNYPNYPCNQRQPRRGNATSGTERRHPATRQHRKERQRRQVEPQAPIPPTRPGP